MKRVISALLSVLLLGCLTACSRDDGQSKNGDSRSGTLKVAIGETNTDFDGVSVRILNLAEDEGNGGRLLAFSADSPFPESRRYRLKGREYIG